MSRATTDAAITTRTARASLSARAEPYWRGIEPGLAVGYRRGSKGGSWLARLLEGRRYREEKLGRADDAVPADGEVVLSFAQAQAKAAAWALKRRRILAGLEPIAVAPQRPYTVADAMKDYLAEYKARGGKAYLRTEQTIAAHILPKLGSSLVGRLTRDSIRAWHRGLASSGPRVRAKAGQVATRHIDAFDEDAQRRRRATANRILTVLKAALNHARSEAAVTCSADAWTLVKPFREADAPRIRYLLDDEVLRLTNACEGDFRDLVVGALLTGARYGELVSMRVDAFDPEAATLHIPRTKGGKARFIVLTQEGCQFFKQLVIGKPKRALMFDRRQVEQQCSKHSPAQLRRVSWGKSHQARPMAEACAGARIIPSIGFHILRHTYGSRLARAGVPMAVIAKQLGHVGTRTTEKHYAHLAPDYVSDTVRASFGPFGVLQATTVAPIRQNSGPVASGR